MTGRRIEKHYARRLSCSVVHGWFLALAVEPALEIIGGDAILLEVVAVVGGCAPRIDYAKVPHSRATDVVAVGDGDANVVEARL